MASTPVPDDVSKGGLPVAEGDVLAGKYRVERTLGQGGMGVVVAATHLTLHQRVALKFLLPAALANPDTIERFLREARAAVRLKSEHAAKVVDVGTLENGSPYMVMEYLEGATLGQVIRQQGALPASDAVDFVLQACEAVAEAHAAGIVHRDLKPENLFLTRRVDGQPLVKVLDFGIAKSQTADGLALTRTTTVIGSPLYMPPEQLRAARNADFRSDIWALGAVLFELTTGRVPFTAETFSELCLKVAQDPAPAPSSLRSDIPPALDAVVLRCLEKDPAKRFQNIAELAVALEPMGSPLARELAQRVALVLSGGRNTPTPSLAISSVSAKAHTGTAWGNTSAEAGSLRKWWLVGGAGGAAVGVAVLVGLTHHGASPPNAASVSGAANPAPTASVIPVVSLSPSSGTPPPSTVAPVDVPPTHAPASITSAQNPQGKPRTVSAAAPTKASTAASPSAASSKKPNDDVVFDRK